MYNPWRTLRTLGGLVVIVGALLPNMQIVFVGLVVQYIGVTGGIDLAERKIDIIIKSLTKEEDQDAVH